MSHIAFPLRANALGRTTTVTDGAYIRTLIEQVLFTQPGERVMRPGFGGGAKALVFEPNGPDLASATEINIHASLNQALGDLLEVTGVEVEADEEILRVTVRFAIRGQPPAETAIFERKRS
jgi:phage baseplate assembly protein W